VSPGPEGTGVLSALQSEIEVIYGVEAPAVDRFVLDGEAHARLGDTAAGEQLLVVESGDGLDVGLYVEESALRVLSAAGVAWTQRRLAAHCLAVEGVSHFVYLTHRAAVPRPVSQLELELQAEIDKFATVLLSLWRAGRREAAGELRRRLFEGSQLREGLPAEARERYEKATVLAGLYCRFLEARYVVRNSVEGLLADLRRVYRLGAGEKLSYAARGAAL